MSLAYKGGLMYYTRFDTALCEVILIGDEEGLIRIHLNTDGSNRELVLEPEWIEQSDFFVDAQNEIEEYFKGKRQTFTIKLNPQGTEFQKKVWQALLEIGYGETVSYKDIAIKIGNINASRAVGMANGKNPIPIIIPCHRVIGSNGKLAGFAFGTKLKSEIISLEKTIDY